MRAGRSLSQPVLTLLVLGLTAIGPSGPLPADDTALISAEPVAVFQLASVDAVLEDMDLLLAAGGVPQYSEFVRGFLGGLNELDGIDRQQPLGVMLFLDPSGARREPAPLIYLPVTDIAALRSTVMGTGNALEPTADPVVYDLRLGQDQLQLTLSGGYGFIVSPDKLPPPYRAARLIHLIEQEQSQFDAVLTLRRVGVPAWMLDGVMGELGRTAEQGRGRRAGESDLEYGLRYDIERSLYELLGLVLTEGEELSAGVYLGPKAPLTVDLEFRCQEGGELRKWAARTFVPPARLPQADSKAPALRWHGAIELPESRRDRARLLLAMTQDELRARLGAGAPEELLQQINHMFAALDATLARGHLESRVEFLPTKEGRFVLLAGTAMEQAEFVDRAARVLLPLATQTGDVQHLKLDALTAGGASFHRVQGKEARRRDRRLYGSGLALYLAGGEGAAWLAVCEEESEPVLTAALAGTPRTEPGPHAATFAIRLRPWIAFALREGIAHNRSVAEMAHEVLTDDATIEAGFRTSERGARLTVVIDDAYVRLLARLAVAQVQGK